MDEGGGHVAVGVLQHRDQVLGALQLYLQKSKVLVCLILSVTDANHIFLLSFLLRTCVYECVTN